MGVNITTIVYLRVLIIQIGSTIILMVVEAQGIYIYCLTLTGWGIPVSLYISGFDSQKFPNGQVKTWQSFYRRPCHSMILEVKPFAGRNYRLHSGNLT